MRGLGLSVYQRYKRVSPNEHLWRVSAMKAAMAGTCDSWAYLPESTCKS